MYSENFRKRSSCIACISDFFEFFLIVIVVAEQKRHKDFYVHYFDSACCETEMKMGMCLYQLLHMYSYAFSSSYIDTSYHLKICP